MLTGRGSPGIISERIEAIEESANPTTQTLLINPLLFDKNNDFDANLMGGADVANGAPGLSTEYIPEEEETDTVKNTANENISGGDVFKEDAVDIDIMKENSEIPKPPVRVFEETSDMVADQIEVPVPFENDDRYQSEETPQKQPPPPPQPRDDDSELYSVKNFSI